MEPGQGEEFTVDREKTLRVPAMTLGPAPEGSEWYCLRTRSRHEKRVARDCSLRRIPFFLPLKQSVRRYKGRAYVFDVPLFSGYLFCAATPEQRYALLNTGHLAQVIEVPDQDGLLRDLNQISLALKRNAPLEPFPYLKRGARVRITEGPMRDIEGIVSERRRKFRVILNVDLLHQAVALEIDAGAVTPI